MNDKDLILFTVAAAAFFLGYAYAMNKASKSTQAAATAQQAQAQDPSTAWFNQWGGWPA